LEENEDGKKGKKKGGLAFSEEEEWAACVDRGGGVQK